MATPAGENVEAAAQPESLETTPNVASSQEQTVPVHVLQSMRDELRIEREKSEAYRNHLDMMRWQQPIQQQAQNPFDNVDPEEPIKVKDALKAIGDLQSRFESKLNEVRMAANPKTNDYEETIKKYLPHASKEDPDILEDIKRSSNPYKTAYAFCKASKAYQDDLLAKHKPTSKPDPEVAKMISNSKQSGNLAAVGNNSQVTSATRYSLMSDDEFRKFKSQNMMRPVKSYMEDGRPTR